MADEVLVEVGYAKFDAAQESASGSDGRRGWAKFRIHADGAIALIEADFGEQAYDVKLDAIVIGEGLTVSTVTVKRGPENELLSSVTFAVPQSACDALAKAMRALNKEGQLTLKPNQMAFDLTTKAE